LISDNFAPLLKAAELASPRTVGELNHPKAFQIAQYVQETARRGWSDCQEFERGFTAPRAEQERRLAGQFGQARHSDTFWEMLLEFGGIIRRHFRYIPNTNFYFTMNFI
jgi:hypothetical protein